MAKITVLGPAPFTNLKGEPVLSGGVAVKVLMTDFLYALVEQPAFMGDLRGARAMELVVRGAAWVRTLPAPVDPELGVEVDVDDDVLAGLKRGLDTFQPSSSMIAPILVKFAACVTAEQKPAPDASAAA